ncbi:hypothetical protein PALI_a3500 [Pseudoalteromonas aliena SW19]|uniref:Uncharacterized protein n=1 Tax=Pseudoalteromonas aliena SW19 TaxID=1314866 RepID=A0ABR9DU28_9GAMM|nr:hypothetical protein [Pseudoalteromonas aliena SW19]
MSKQNYNTKFTFLAKRSSLLVLLFTKHSLNKPLSLLNLNYIHEMTA